MKPKLPKNWILNKIMSEKKIYGTGRRKNSIARVFMEPGKGDIKVNGKILMTISRGKFFNK